MDTLNDLNERVDAFVGTSSFDTPAAANDQAPIDVPAEVHEDIVASSISPRSSSQTSSPSPR